MYESSNFVVSVRSFFFIFFFRFKSFSYILKSDRTLCVAREQRMATTVHTSFFIYFTERINPLNASNCARRTIKRKRAKNNLRLHAVDARTCNTKPRPVTVAFFCADVFRTRFSLCTFVVVVTRRTVTVGRHSN